MSDFLKENIKIIKINKSISPLIRRKLFLFNSAYAVVCRRDLPLFNHIFAIIFPTARFMAQFTQKELKLLSGNVVRR